jgi:hypothetical protein
VSKARPLREAFPTFKDHMEEFYGPLDKSWQALRKYPAPKFQLRTWLELAE